MRIAIVSDAWKPQVNGVVTTLVNTVGKLRELDHEVDVINPADFRTVPCPGYPEIRLAVLPGRRFACLIEAAAPDAIHIATEGPLGMAARAWCLRNGVAFATSYHTRFPEYLRLRAPIPTAATYSWLRRFHAPAHVTLVRTVTQKKLLESRGFENLAVWPGAVDTEIFRPRGKGAIRLPRPISMYMGRVAVEKGLEDFLGLDLPGSKVVIGTGPDLEQLKRAYPEAHFLGAKFGEDLAFHLSAADVFVFPSRTDTLGLVMLEAMACGVPVAAFPVPGPQDLITDGANGATDENLQAAVFRALRLNPEDCMEFAHYHCWLRSTRIFLNFQRSFRRSDDPEEKLATTAH